MIKIGITGHRFLAELEKINAAIEEALRHIEAHFPAQPLTVLSSISRRHRPNRCASHFKANRRKTNCRFAL